MSLDLIISEPDAEEMIVDPASGEAVILHEASDELVARVLGAIQERLEELARAKRYLGREMIARFDRQAEWTLHAPGVKITSPSATDTKTEWDAAALAVALDDLVTEGVITREAASRACEQRVEYRAMLRGIQAICKVPGVAERIQHCSSTVASGERQVRVSVTP